MASGPVGGGIARSRSLWRFLSIDPEIYPLLGVLATTFGIAGYMVGRKAANTNQESNVKLATHEPFPWHAGTSNQGRGDSTGGSNDGGQDYKYKFHKFGDPNQEAIKAPSADTSHIVQVKLPKDDSRKVEEKFGNNS
ncbi:6208_t:CDS:1 [Funneliformis geosporum]|uniref:8959_t:CDS:1 n=1 Tax=Funneliformis geosporum TaxID=1117311 RepID=A0A9W4SYH4_9GLOM|nr:6208_t:CDS:1 [Funneliformis geosporum]CAI2183720.1 8959_t:CDS:1 [Funneliformis geosporum]